MSAQIAFDTPEDVELSYDVAGPGSRLAAGLIDMTIIGLVIATSVAGLLAGGVLAVSVQDLLDGDLTSGMSPMAIASLVAMAMGVNVTYFIAAERIMNGQSPGKRLIGLRVMREGGYALTWPATIVRNVARLVDFLPGPYLVALLSVLVSRQRKRLGDFMAGTVVVRYVRAPLPLATPMSTRDFPFTRQQISTLDEETFELIDGYLARKHALAPQARVELERSLIEALSTRMNLNVPSGQETEFLAALAEAMRSHMQA